MPPLTSAAVFAWSATLSLTPSLSFFLLLPVHHRQISPSFLPLAFSPSLPRACQSGFLLDRVVHRHHGPRSGSSACQGRSQPKRHDPRRAHATCLDPRPRPQFCCVWNNGLLHPSGSGQCRSARCRHSAAPAGPAAIHERPRECRVEPGYHGQDEGLFAVTAGCSFSPSCRLSERRSDLSGRWCRRCSRWSCSLRQSTEQHSLDFFSGCPGSIVPCISPARWPRR